MMRISVFSLLLVCAGCAGVDARRVTSWSDDTAGFRYYMPQPCILVEPMKASPFRIDFTKDKGQYVGPGHKVRVELGTLEGVASSATITATLSDTTHIGFASPLGGSDKQTAVKADPTTGIVSADVRFKKPVEGADVSVSIAASVGTDSLGSGRYRLSKSDSDILVTSLGGAVAPAPAAKIIYVPNPERVMAVEPFNGIGGSTELDIKIVDGWMLTSVGTKSDTQSDENITALATLVEKIGGAVPSLAALSTKGGPEAPTPSDVLSPGLYCARFDDKGQLVAFRRIMLE